MNKLLSVVKVGKTIGFEMPKDSRILCQCIGEPYSDDIVSAFNIIVRENERLRETLQESFDAMKKWGKTGNNLFYGVEKILLEYSNRESAHD